MLQTFVFQQEQAGAWGRTLLNKRIAIKALNKDEAWVRVKLRSDFYKRLRNGDYLTWQLVESPVLLDDLVSKMTPERSEDI